MKKISEMEWRNLGIGQRVQLMFDTVDCRFTWQWRFWNNAALTLREFEWFYVGTSAAYMEA